MNRFVLGAAWASFVLGADLALAEEPPPGAVVVTPPTATERSAALRPVPPIVYAVPGAGGCAAPCAPSCCPETPCCERRDACGFPADECGRAYGRFEITLEGLWSFLNDADDRPLGEASGDPDEITWGGIEFGGEFGGRVTLAWRATSSDRIEARGAWYGQWDESSSEAGVFGFEPGVDPGVDESDPVFADLTVDSELWSGELNYWTEVSCEGRLRWDVGFGVRYIQFNEEATAFVVNQDTFAAGSVFADVENTFLGGQVMGAVHADLSDRLTASLSAKALVGNLNRDMTVETDSLFVGGATAGSSEEDQIVWGLDVEAGLRLRVSRWLAFTGGYQFLFLDDVQRGFDAMDFSRADTGAVQPNREEDQLVVHAFFLGVSLTL